MVWKPEIPSAFGMYGFVLVPVTYIATRLWQIHPGPVVATSEGSLNSDMSIVLFLQYHSQYLS